MVTRRPKSRKKMTWGVYSETHLAPTPEQQKSQQKRIDAAFKKSKLFRDIKTNPEKFVMENKTKMSKSDILTTLSNAGVKVNKIASVVNKCYKKI